MGFGAYLVLLLAADSISAPRWAPVAAGLFIVGLLVGWTVMHFVNTSRAARGRRFLEDGRGDVAGTLVLRRGGLAEVGFLRRMKVRVDGTLVAMLPHNGEVSVDLAPGEYEISAQIGSFGGEPLRVPINEGETVAVRLSTEIPADLALGVPRASIRAELI
ncbi:hypothetical protein [Catenuloplanes atrovinosus]|uniref:Uncharacterized protein n=1 Tax=Catenuloplanes atrovinosus TaxID=137266 RepID=A0AAE4CCR7_9ACTN|nr:hypothetical protein [Catenuloplanes atrovinosus]MDR7279911.1 hypothetical protein [Catenuloplanes atrovinosus]